MDAPSDIAFRSLSANDADKLRYALVEVVKQYLSEEWNKDQEEVERYCEAQMKLPTYQRDAYISYKVDRCRGCGKDTPKQIRLCDECVVYLREHPGDGVMLSLPANTNLTAKGVPIWDKGYSWHTSSPNHPVAPR